MGLFFVVLRNILEIGEEGVEEKGKMDLFNMIRHEMIIL